MGIHATTLAARCEGLRVPRRREPVRFGQRATLAAPACQRYVRDIVRSHRVFTGDGVTAAVLGPLVIGLEAAGIDPARVLGPSGLSVSDLERPDLRIPREVSGDVWRRAVEISGDPAFGLHVAERMPPGAFGLFEFVARNSPTVRAALDRIASYTPLVADGLRFELDVTPERATFGYSAIGKPFPPVISEFILSSLYRYAVGGTRPRMRFLEVWFTHPGPEDSSVHRSAFDARVRFAAPANALVFDPAFLEARLERADPSLFGVLDQVSRERLRQLPPASSFEARVRKLIAAELARGDATSQGIAKQLNMSARTLHRRLREAGTTHRALLDDVRHGLALRFLEQRELGIAEIAYALGFSEVSALRKAFKRWTGSALASSRSRLKAT